MSIKNLFGKGVKNYQSSSAFVESPVFINEEVKERRTYIPPIDFASASNFVNYGLAEAYYENSIARIHNDYPYDGSKAEQVSFHQSSSYLDRWMFEEKYPKTTGYITLGTTGYSGTKIGEYGLTAADTPEYIRVWGGIHTASSGMAGKPLRETFDKSGKYDLSLNRTQNWDLSATSGSTIEFWLKIPSFDYAKTGNQVILDLWNSEDTSSSDYGRLTLELRKTSSLADPDFYVTFQRGAAGFQQQVINTAASLTETSMAEWHHYAVSFDHSNAGITTRFYVDGQANRTRVLGSSFPITQSIDGLINGYVGALQTTPKGASPVVPAYAGKLSGSLDEFRFWKKTRTGQEIGLNWFRQIGGGVNTDDETANSNLGVYFKFNEGIAGSIPVDRTILDYSGRLANGYWKGYSKTTQRNTGSAMASSSYAYVEEETPIIYSTNPRVVSLNSEMSTSGSLYDNESGNSLFYSLPSWIVDQDMEEGNNNLKNLTQIMASYFDTLHAQISAIPNLANKEYVQDKDKAIPFASHLLSNKGFLVQDILVDSNVVNMFSNVDYNSVKFEDNLDRIKNLIYTNIYNNLEAIYKSKGTAKSIRNFIRCFGVDDEIIKLNVYTDGGTHYFTDKAKGTSVKKKYLSFNEPSYFGSTICQTSSVNNPLTFISGSTGSVEARNNAFTLEADIVVPYKRTDAETGYFTTPFLSSSIFGFNESTTEPSDFTWATSATASLSVYLVRDELESKNAKFVVETQDGSLHLTSSYFQNIYDNNHWNLALRVKPDTYPYAGNVTNTSPTYTLDFYAVNYNFDELENVVSLSTTLSNESGSAFLSNPKRVYAGAHLTNFTGAVRHRSDIQVGAIRAWLDYIENSAIQAHNKDPLNFGNSEAYRDSNIFTLNNKNIPSQELTIFNWEFNLVTGSNSGGNFNVEDITSGSTNTIYEPWLDELIRREYRGRGHGFGASKTNFVENEYLYAQKKELPEISYTNDNIFIKTDKDINFIKDDDVSDNFYALEKSMNQIVSEEMLKLFSSVHEFANLMGRPVDRYRMNYKRLDKVRQDFFERVEGNPDQERFIQFYKWIDGNISKMIRQLIPAAVNFGSGVTDVVESHILERNKYQRRVGLLDQLESTTGQIKGIQELTYNWKYGHSPFVRDGNQNCLWRKEREIRKGDNSADREAIRVVSVNQIGLSEKYLVDKMGLPRLATDTKTIYTGSAFVMRRLSRPYNISIDMNNSIHGGINYPVQKDREFYKSVTWFFGKKGPSNAPENIYTVGVTTGSDIIEPQRCTDVYNPNKKTYVNFECTVGKNASGYQGTTPKDPSLEYVYRMHSSMYWPFNVISGTIKTGYNSHVYENYNTSSIVTNIHSDTVDLTNEIPLQGPFTNAHVGGNQSRHINLNKYDASRKLPGGAATLNGLETVYNRPEAFRYLFGENPLNDPAAPTPADGAMGLTGPDYGVVAGSPGNDTTKKFAVWFREERAKRPVNIKNIQTTTASAVHGNYQHKYEVLSTFGMSSQRFLLRHDYGDVGLMGNFYDSLPETTQPITLFPQRTIKEQSCTGSIWMPDIYDTFDFAGRTARIEFYLKAEAEYESSGRHAFIYLTDNFGKSVTYVFQTTGSAGTGDTNAFGTVIFIGTTGATTTTIATQTKNAIESANGHNGSITVTQASGDLSLQVAGDGNRSVFPEDSETILLPRTDLTSSRSIITTRFAAPGGIEVESRGFLDITSGEFSVYNSMNYRNLTVRSSGSGEAGTIRVNSNLNKREGNRTLLARWCGKGGMDSQYGSISWPDSGSLAPMAAFYKQHRNSLVVPRIKSSKLRNAVYIGDANASKAGLTYLSSDFGWNTIGSNVVSQGDPFSISFYVNFEAFRPNGKMQYFFDLYSGGTITRHVIEFFLQIHGSGIYVKANFVSNTPIVGTANYEAELTQWDLLNGELKEKRWYFITLSFPGFGKPAILYIDGEDQFLNQFLYTGPNTNITGNRLLEGADSMIIGGDITPNSPTDNEELQGSLSNFAIWKTKLTPPQIKQLYTANGDGLAMPFYSSLRQFWSLGEEEVLKSLSPGTGLPIGTRIPSSIGGVPLISYEQVSASLGPYAVNTFEDVKQYDNMNYTSLLPRSAFQYSWIRQAVEGSTDLEIAAKQKLRGYVPKSGQMVMVGNGAMTKLEDAITFPTISDILCAGCEEGDDVVPSMKYTIPVGSYSPSAAGTYTVSPGGYSSVVYKVVTVPSAADEITQTQLNNITFEYSGQCCDGKEYEMVVKGNYGSSTCRLWSTYQDATWSPTPREVWSNTSDFCDPDNPEFPMTPTADLLCEADGEIYIRVSTRCGTDDGNTTSIEFKFTGVKWAGDSRNS